MNVEVKTLSCSSWIPAACSVPVLMLLLTGLPQPPTGWLQPRNAIALLLQLLTGLLRAQVDPSQFLWPHMLLRPFGHYRLFAEWVPGIHPMFP